MKLRNKITKEICDADAREDGIYIKANWSDEEKWFCYDLETLARGWEYYVEPKEPLIKDEKVRKAVRAWAEVVGEDTFIVSYNMEYHDCCIYTGNLSNTATIDFGIDLNLKGGSHTIAELCGEEE